MCQLCFDFVIAARNISNKQFEPQSILSNHIFFLLLKLSLACFAYVEHVNEMNTQ